VQRNRQNLHPKVNERSLETQQRKAMRNEGISSPKKEFDDLERQGRRLRLYLSANLAIVSPKKEFDDLERQRRQLRLYLSANLAIISPKKKFDDLERQRRRLRLYLSANLAIVSPFPVSEIQQPGLTAYRVTMIL